MSSHAPSPTVANVGRNFGRASSGELVTANPARLQKLESFLNKRYGATVEFTDSVGLGMIDELSGTIKLNPANATWEVFSHEISHVRFSNAVGKWRTGQSLTNFEVNLMESIGYWGTYRRSGVLSDFYAGSSWSQSAISGLKSGNAAARNSFNQSTRVFGQSYVEDALRFNGAGLAPRKSLP